MSEKVDEKVEEYFAVTLNFDLNSVSTAVNFFNYSKDHIDSFGGDRYYSEDFARRLFEATGQVSLLGLELESLQYDLAGFISQTKLAILQDKAPNVDKEKFTEFVTRFEQCKKDLIEVHDRMKRLTVDLQKETKNKFGV